MSYTETHIGKLRKVDTQGQSVKDWCINRIIDTKGFFDEKEDDWQDDFWDTDNNYDKYVFYGDDLYETFDHIEKRDEDIDIFTDNGDGTYSFVMQFYNGGTCLQECLEDGLKRLKK